jgi:hypothetical protein
MISRYASLRQGLVGAWCPSLGASGFRLIDRSGNNHGVLTNMDPGTDWVPSGGKLALDFDGVNDNVNIGNIFQYDWQVPRTFSWWMQHSFSGNANIFSKQQNSGSFIGWGVGFGPAVQPFFFAGQGCIVNFPSSYNDGLLHHFVVTWNGSGVVAGFSGWVDGSPVALSQHSTFSQISTTVVTASDTQMNGRGGGNYTFPGRMDDMRLYNRVLTPSEIQLLYTGGRGVGLMPERIKHRRKTTAAATNRRRRIICGANC